MTPIMYRTPDILSNGNMMSTSHIETRLSSIPKYNDPVKALPAINMNYIGKHLFDPDETKWFQLRQQKKSPSSSFSISISIELSISEWITECKKSFKNENLPCFFSHELGKWIKIIELSTENGIYNVAISFQYIGTRWIITDIYLDGLAELDRLSIPIQQVMFIDKDKSKILEELEKEKRSNERIISSLKLLTEKLANEPNEPNEADDNDENF